MRRKMIYIIILILLPTIAIPMNLDPTEQLDQEQTLATTSGSVVCNKFWIAQSFVPTLPVLTRVELRLLKMNKINSDFVVGIRENLTGDDLTKIAISSNKIYSSPSWINFDFKDIRVIPGKTYYIVCRTNGGNWSLKYMYKWSCSELNPYPNGQLYCSLDGGLSWDGRYYAPKDQCFKTYGFDDVPPETKCIISGDIGKEDWYISNVKITLKANDSSGINYTKYRIDEGNWKNYETSFIFTKEGVHKIEFYSVDKMNNKEETKTTIFKIDKEAPSGSLIAPKSGYIYIFNKKVMPTLNNKALIIGNLKAIALINDNASGIENVTFETRLEEEVDNIPPYEFNLPSYNPYGEDTLIVYVSDKAGNSVKIAEVDYIKIK